MHSQSSANEESVDPSMKATKSPHPKEQPRQSTSTKSRRMDRNMSEPTLSTFSDSDDSSCEDNGVSPPRRRRANGGTTTKKRKVKPVKRIGRIPKKPTPHSPTAKTDEFHRPSMDRSMSEPTLSTFSDDDDDDDDDSVGPPTRQRANRVYSRKKKGDQKKTTAWSQQTQQSPRTRSPTTSVGKHQPTSSKKSPSTSPKRSIRTKSGERSRSSDKSLSPPRRTQSNKSLSLQRPRRTQSNKSLSVERPRRTQSNKSLSPLRRNKTEDKKNATWTSRRTHPPTAKAHESQPTTNAISETAPTTSSKRSSRPSGEKSNSCNSLHSEKEQRAKRKSQSPVTTKKKTPSKSQSAAITEKASCDERMAVAVQDIDNTTEDTAEDIPSLVSEAVLKEQSPSPQEKATYTVGKQRSDNVVTFAVVESHSKIYKDTQEPSTKWYSEEDLSTLLTHEISIYMRLAQSNQKGSLAKTKSMHCCGRGFEHIEMQYDKDKHIHKHVQQVLAGQLELQGDEPETMAMKLRLLSQMDSKLDRKLAGKRGMEDAREPFERVQREQMEFMQQEVDTAALSYISSKIPTKDAFTAACKLASHAVKGTRVERPVHGTVALVEHTYGSTRNTMSRACSLDRLDRPAMPNARTRSTGQLRKKASRANTTGTSKRGGFFSRASTSKSFRGQPPSIVPSLFA